ncbi:hypothetical protein A3C21_03325 [Candidatus Kaiserbacteria bacterium RIFCSPHIGHO2_02_FULL_59_21]|uniref:Uncharacterized protein n=1 Tax=Candidatus Kaiserbacteria bacterium RIFCSPHIGHO2_02_FULL_59_21 TaxID=1798500 RepID=A0A1F6DZG3_9BACT|nr:MAG: hypothetical protein A2766_00265 [Candidatus Kaiserbacteria bacterium RIFCSPHIGHO2_01_FULL_58_22]OGG66690.1 MAG: hypothetical protein A3C21_03325 [Candidatus Kaiserbacteria bacterium RIFCSPHIGHO2_02_FULL_59_21]OGG79067.1 MAG: hypothetical protein A2952_02770 [Candidatus Kaiserbacteria bacterium RIFCSPLOWO2_01_FULL_59_34]OGG84440.1 MAG: hypothetical protein A3I47_02175 [Candidatus Kaiserbacteria bacterium RIFCSPLOWO2_02_FULL_59_19]
MRVEGSKLPIKTFLFTHNTKIVTRKSKSKHIKFWYFFKIYFLNRSADDTFFISVVNITSVCFTSISVVIVCPNRLDTIDGIFVFSKRPDCAKSKPAGAGK